MNQQKDLIQHIAVLTVAPSYLNFAQRRSSEIIHVGLAETKALLRDCLRIMAVESNTKGRDSFQIAGADLVLRPYAEAFRQAIEQIDALEGQVWEDDLDAHSALDPIICDLDGFLSGEHWYDMEYAHLLQISDGSFYSDKLAKRVNFVPNWQFASLLFTEAVTERAQRVLWERDCRRTQAVPLLSLAPPDGYLWMARTYAPQNPQSLINYWEAMLPGARRMRIRQMVSQQSV